jgi:hypothetical protein
MLNVTIHLGSATPFSSRAGPRAPACHERLSAPAPLSLPLGPTRLHLARLCANSDAPPARVAPGSRSGCRPPVGARPHDRPRTTWHPHGRTPFSSPFSLSATPSTELAQKHGRPRSAPPLEHHLPPHRSHAWTAAPPSPDCLGEPRLHSSCPAPPRDPTGARRQHLGVVEPPPSWRRACHHTRTPRAVTTSRACDARALPRATQVVFPAGTSHQAAASRLLRPTARSRPPHPVGCSLGPVSAQYCAAVFKCFSIVLNSRNRFKLQKFIETCRSVQNLQNKFSMNPFEPLFTVDLTKLNFAS